MVREETTGAMDSTGNAGRDGLVDSEGTGIAMMRCTSRRGVLIAVSMTSFARVAVAMRHVVCVIVHDSTRWVNLNVGYTEMNLKDIRDKTINGEGMCLNQIILPYNIIIL